ncbi:hypothetical protein EDB83DRAFT_2672133 [Lactarius deliciosus]|nr:hypothetical protein EDB83DRAFT_2672133 [Lactarius deliciosus]
MSKYLLIKTPLGIYTDHWNPFANRPDSFIMPALIPVDNDLGVFFLGVIFSSILYGVIWLQVYSYFSQHCEGDGLFLKCFVTLLLILDTLQLALVVYGFYVAGVTNFGDYLANLRAPWSLSVQGLIGSMSAPQTSHMHRPLEHTHFPVILTCSVQQFYAWRIYHLSMGRIHVPAFIVILSLAELGLGIVYLVHGFQYPYFDQAKVQIPNLTAGFSIQVVCDLTITASMVYNLLMRHETVVKRANFAITTVLALYCISSGALTLVFAITCLATIVRFTYTLIYVLLFFVLVRLYGCAFMAVLNSRNRLRTSLNAEVEKGTNISFSHGTPTLSHVGCSDVTSASVGASASNVDAIDPRFATQSTISGISQTKVSMLRFTESEWRGLSEVDGTKAEHERTSKCDRAVNP